MEHKNLNQNFSSGLELNPCKILHTCQIFLLSHGIPKLLPSASQTPSKHLSCLWRSPANSSSLFPSPFSSTDRDHSSLGSSIHGCRDCRLLNTYTCMQHMQFISILLEKTVLHTSSILLFALF